MRTRLTQHARDRGRERIALPATAIGKLADRALAQGAAPASFAGRLRRYLDDRSRAAGLTVRLYAEHVWLFDAQQAPPALITVHGLPSDLRRMWRRIRAKERAMDDKSNETEPTTEDTKPVDQADGAGEQATEKTEESAGE